MPAPEKKRELADFFKPRARAKLFPTAGNLVPQKRPSPSTSPETENIPLPKIPLELAKATPTKRKFPNDIRSPTAPSFSPVSATRSGSLPIRSPYPKSAAKPAAVYKNARLFEASPRSPNASPSKECLSSESDSSTLSFATVSQPPPSTQAVVKEGKVVAVRDSDEDDSDSLKSLDEIFGKRREDDTTSLSSPPEADEAKLEAERRRTLSLFTFGRSEPLIGKDKLRSVAAKERERKANINRFMNDHLNDEQEEQKVQKSREQYAQSLKALESGQQNELNTELLATLLQSAGGDEEEVARVMSAVSRTDALSSEKAFSFFGPSGIRDLEAGTQTDVDFPQTPLLDDLFRDYDDEGRSRAYLSGFMTELASIDKLPDDVLKWTFDSVLTEKDDDLRQSYIECLRQGSDSWTRTNVDVHDVRKICELLGADPSSLKDPIQPRHHSLRKKPLLTSKRLLSILDLFQAICPHMDFVALSSLVSITCRLSLDEELMSQAAISCKVEDLLQSLLSLPDRDTRDHITACIYKDMTAHLHAPNLQAQLLSHMLPTSPSACSLRTKLAITFLLGSTSSCLQDTTHPTHILDALATHVLTAPSFNTSLSNARHLNYAHLRSHTHILDVAISNGQTPPSFPSRTDENLFNKSVDALADAIHIRYTAISDSGASHMLRTEAKDALTALYWRVLVAVRTKGRVKKHVFDQGVRRVRVGEEVRAERGGREAMKAFLRWRKEGGRKEARGEEGGVDEQGQRQGEDNEVMSSYASAREDLESGK